MAGEAERSGAKIKRVLAWAAAVLAAVFIVAVLALNTAVRWGFDAYYDDSILQGKIPGIDVGFVPQDLDYLDAADAWLYSGYVADGSPSPVYRRDADGSSARLEVRLPDGELYRGHGSAITSSDDYCFLACGEGYAVLDAAAVADAADGSVVDALDVVSLDFAPAFMNIEGDELLAGDFYYPNDYETPAEHRVTTPDGSENPAVVYGYPSDARGRYGFSDKADRVYSIPGMVQGICVNEEGWIVLSCSYGLAASHLYGYDMAALTQDGTFNADGRDVPLYCLDGRSLVADLAAPPMLEGIESHEGLVYVTDEAASNKYLFGKLYGGGYVRAVDLARAAA